MVKIDKRVLADVGSYLTVIGITASVTYTVVKDVFQRRQDKAIQEIRDYYKKKIEVEKPEPSPVNTVGNDDPDSLERVTDLVKNRYHGDIVDDQVTSFEELRPVNRKMKDVYILTSEEFYQDDGDFEKVSALYYEGDDVATDQFDEAMDDYSHILGTEFLTEFVKEGANKRAYVRNTILKTDYEIDLIESSYAKEVLGYEERQEPNRPRKFRADD